MTCDICPNINITNEDKAVVSIKYCILEAALKHAKDTQETCGRELVVTLNQEPALTDEEIDSKLVEYGLRDEPCINDKLSNKQIRDALQFIDVESEPTDRSI
jgi:hypothetical protein